MRINGHDHADDRASRYCMAALDSALDTLRSTGSDRNATLNKIAFGLAQLVSTGGLTEDVIRDTLTPAAIDAGLGRDEVRDTLKSAIRSGLACPRQLPEKNEKTRRTSPRKTSSTQSNANSASKPARRPGLDIEAYLARCRPAAGDDGYIVRKGGAPDGLMIAAPVTVAGHNVSGWLTVPAYDLDCNLQTCQFIPGEHGLPKLSAPGHQIGGAMFVVGSPDGRPSAAVFERGVVYLVEGIATAWTVYQLSGIPAFVAFGKSNLDTIARDVRERHSGVRIVIAPDVGGEHQAAEIVRGIGAPAGWVEMPEGLPKNFDLNDLAATEDGERLVREVLGKVKEPTSPQRRFKLSTVTEICARAFPDWIIPNLMPSTGTGTWYGESGSGKSFSILDGVIAISRGRRWGNHRTRRSKVIYVVLEGSLRARIDAYKRHHRLTDQDLEGLMIVEDVPMNLLTDGEAEAFIEDVRAGLGEYDRLVVVIDTLARAMPGGNENTSEDMGTIVANVDRIAREMNALVILVHHSGKDSSRGARGWSGLKAAMDMEVEIARNGDERTLTFSKVKDGLDGVAFGFKLEVIDLGPRSNHDPDAEPHERITSCVAVMGEQVTGASRAAKDPVKTNAFIAALRAQGGRAKKSDLRKLLTDGENRVMSSSTFYYIVNELVAQEKLESGVATFTLMEAEK